MQKLLKRLAAVSIAAGCSLGVVGPTLLDVPTRVIEDLLDDIEGLEAESWDPDDRRRLLAVLANDPRPAVRARAAESSSLVHSSEGERILQMFAHDPEPAVQRSAASGLAEMLADLEPLARTALIARWVLSDTPSERRVVARALAWPVAVVGCDVALDLLCGDSDTRVRRAASATLSARSEWGDLTIAQLARRLVHSRDPVVRRTARKIARRMA